jgi:hypothetical protein
MIYRDPDPPRRPRPTPEPIPEPISGEEIRLSNRGDHWALLGCLSVLALGAAAAGSWCLTMYEWAVGAAPFPTPAPLAAGVAIGVAATVRARPRMRKIRVSRRIVSGRKCVQVQEGRGRGTRVTAHVPFENVEVLKLTRIDFGYRIEVELIDVHDSQTYPPGTDLEANYLAHGYHVALAECSLEAGPDIRNRLLRAWKKWRKKNRSRE